MMKTQKCLSPTKQNVSPTKQSFRDCSNIGQFLALVKAAGLKVPNSLQKKLLQGSDGLLKLKPATENSQQDYKKIKVKLGDAQFELKKLEEDFAQYKLVSRQQKQKEVRKWEQAYNKLKSTLEDSNEDSSIKILKLKENAANEIRLLKEKHEAGLKQEIQKLKSMYEERIQSQKRMKERQIAELKKNYQKELADLKLKYETEFEQTKKLHQFEIRKQALKSKQVLESKEKQFESIYTAIQSQKKTEQKLHEKTKVEASQAKEKLYSELYLQRNLKKGLEEDIVKLEKEIKSLKITIKDLELEQKIEKDRTVKRQKKLMSDFQVQKIGQQQLYKQKIASILSSHQKELSKFEQKISQLNQWKENREVLMDEKVAEIQKVFSERPSRKQDLETIEKMKNRLSRKEEQARLLNKQLKACALEIENKEETYNRIFTSSTVNKLEKRSLARDREDIKSRDSLCRKSQTTDIKFLLKVYNKHL